MWEISNSWQLLSLLRAAALGAAFCLLYDVLRAVRATRDFSSLSVFLTDIAYFVIIAPAAFCFLLSLTNGQLRGYVFFGIAVGFFAVRLVLSRILLKFFSLIFSSVFKLFAFIGNLFGAFFDKAEGFFCKISDFAVKKSKKAVNCFKKGLKK